MIVVIGNQKGGAGKSTVTLLLANYLTMVKSKEVTVLDMDYQQSLVQRYEKAKVLENEEPYEVVPSDLRHYPSLYTVLKGQRSHLVLIDLPGKLDDDGLIDVFKTADLVICPFSYDEFSYNSTILFSLVVRKIKEDVPLLYIPNRIKGSVRYETRLEIDKQLKELGELTDALSDRVDFQRITTYHIPLSLFPVILPVFDPIYERYFSLQKT